MASLTLLFLVSLSLVVGLSTAASP